MKTRFLRAGLSGRWRVRTVQSISLQPFSRITHHQPTWPWRSKVSPRRHHRRICSIHSATDPLSKFRLI